VLDKVKESALSFLKSSNKTVKNKATTFKNFAFVKNFNTCKADNYKNSFSFKNKQL
jgi:hypothetical protein